jgi:hypothetical protein
MRGILGVLLGCAGVVLVCPMARADEPARAGGRVSNLKVLSDKIDDVTTVENILKSFVKPGMSQAERAKALWTAVVKYRHQAPPANEFLAADWESHDPVKVFNVYGYCMCCCSSALVEALNRLDGRQARGRILNNHSVPEVQYDGGWHMYDASLITLFPKPGSGALASVDEIAQAVNGWYARHPDYKGKPRKLDELLRSEQWTGWKTKGPELLANCPYYTKGFFPARTHGWNSTMLEYNRQCPIYEYGYHIGHRALFSLRPGEALVREAGNRGLYLRSDNGPRWKGLQATAPNDDLVYVKDFVPGYKGGVVANGYHRYAPDLASGGLAAGAERYDNLAAGGSPALHLKRGGKPGVAVIEMSSPYVYLGGRLTLKALRKSAGDKVTVSISTNNGRTFTPLWSAPRTGASKAVVSLDGKIYRRYAYWLKIEIVAGAAEGTGLETLSVENDIQHAPRTLPRLGPGSNTVTVAADRETALASRTVACRITPDAHFAKNESSGSMGVAFENLKVQDGSCWWQRGTGVMTVPVETPGDLVALRYCTQFRARGPRDTIRVLLSFDEGKSWKLGATLTGPTPGKTESFRFAQIPRGTRKARVRFELSGTNTIGILSFRIDADYRDPLAARTFRPFDVVYRWKEEGREKTHRQTVKKLPLSYRIQAGTAAEMVSVSYEMAAK